jgi:hypothetical protein
MTPTPDDIVLVILHPQGCSTTNEDDDCPVATPAIIHINSIPSTPIHNKLNCVREKEKERNEKKVIFVLRNGNRDQNEDENKGESG